MRIFHPRTSFSQLLFVLVVVTLTSLCVDPIFAQNVTASPGSYGAPGSTPVPNSSTTPSNSTDILLPVGSACDPETIVNYFFCPVSEGVYEFVYYSHLVAYPPPKGTVLVIPNVVSGPLEGDLLIRTEIPLVLENSTISITGTLTIEGSVSFLSTKAGVGQVVVLSAFLFDIRDSTLFVADSFSVASKARVQKTNSTLTIRGRLEFESSSSFFLDGEPQVLVGAEGCVNFQEGVDIFFILSGSVALASTSNSTEAQPITQPIHGMPCEGSVSPRVSVSTQVSFLFVSTVTDGAASEGSGLNPGEGSGTGFDEVPVVQSNTCTPPLTSIFVLFFGAKDDCPPPVETPLPPIPDPEPLFPTSKFTVPVPVTYSPSVQTVADDDTPSASSDSTTGAEPFAPGTSGTSPEPSTGLAPSFEPTSIQLPPSPPVSTTGTSEQTQSTSETNDSFTSEPWFLIVVVIASILVVVLIAVAIVFATPLKDKIFEFRRMKKYETQEIYD